MAHCLCTEHKLRHPIKAGILPLDAAYRACLSVTRHTSFPASNEPFAATDNTFKNAASVTSLVSKCVGECGRAKCKKYDQQSSMEETLQELERPAADEPQQPGPNEDGTTAIVQRTPSSVIN